jgi:hypothetical protein
MVGLTVGAACDDDEVDDDIDIDNPVDSVDIDNPVDTGG